MATETPETGEEQTILAAVVAHGAPLLTADEADKQILQLLQQVGDLECAIVVKQQTLEGLHKRVQDLMRRNVALEDGIKAISAKCVWRECRCCNLNCGGRTFCNTKGLNPITL